MKSQNPDISLKRIGWALHAGGVLLAGIGIALVANYVMRPIEQQRKSVVEENTRLEGLLAKAGQVRQEYRRVVEKMEYLKAQKALLRKRITDDANEEEFLRQVEELADQVDLKLRSYQPGVTVTYGDYGAMDIDLSCEGRYESVCRFLDQLQELARLTKVTHLDVKAPARGEIYPLKVTVQIFFARTSAPDKVVQAQEGNRA
jgi:Tfp pilus assembly protein PilO